MPEAWFMSDLNNKNKTESQNWKPSFRLISCVSVKHTTLNFFMYSKCAQIHRCCPTTLLACLEPILDSFHDKCGADNFILDPMQLPFFFFWHIWNTENHLRWACVAMSGISESEDRMMACSSSLTCWEMFALKPPKPFSRHKEQWEQLLLDTQGSSAPGQFAHLYHEIGIWGCVSFDKVSVGKLTAVLNIFMLTSDII